MMMNINTRLRHVYFTLTTFALLSITKRAFAQDDPVGFISIDCGSDVDFYRDPRTNLTWQSDKDYILAGKNGFLPKELDINTTSDNYQALRSFRYFPVELFLDPLPQRPRFCYEMQMASSNISFLLRIMLLHGNSSDLPLPIEFDIYVNNTMWRHIQFSEGDPSLFDVYVAEGLFFAPVGGRRTNVCLVPIQGMPFIQSLELRELDPDGIMYSKSYAGGWDPNVYFDLTLRVNAGAGDHDLSVRYPDDMYDRLWDSPSYWFPANLSNPSLSSGKAGSSQTNFITNAKLNNVPYKVMADAWTDWYKMPYSLDFQNVVPGTTFYVLFYFFNFDSNQEKVYPDSTNISVTLDNTEYDAFVVTNQSVMKSYFHLIFDNFTELDFSHSGPFTLNAFEYYERGAFSTRTTRLSDAAVINKLKEDFQLSEWQGDPCTPTPYTWIWCKLDNGRDGLGSSPGGEYFLVWIALQNLQNSSKLLDFGNLNLGLEYLTILNSSIDDEICDYLFEGFANLQYLTGIELQSNNVTKLPKAAGAIYNYDLPFTYLNLSSNQLREVPVFANITFGSQMTVLDLSANRMVGNFPDRSHFSNLGKLWKLQLQNNILEGPIPESLSLFNLPSLGYLDISHNRFTGSLNSTYYFEFLLDGSRNFHQLIADYNQITGVLDVTAWYQKLQRDYVQYVNNKTFAQSYYTFANISDSDSVWLFSFVNNSIEDIKPRAEVFQPILELFMRMPTFNKSGIMLSGNPYCKNAKDFEHRYFCRSQADDIVPGDTRKGNKTLVTVCSVVGGTILLSCFIILSLVIWRLSRKIIILKKIQQELANRMVQPPYYSYSDLKLATQNFHEENKLGRGTFGTVYKGILPDGTTIAVKKLLNSHRKQVLEEFLNEVVLITGIKHKNLVQLKGCCIENQERILVYEYAENGNVEAALWGKTSAANKILDWKTRFNLCLGIARGLSYLHEELQPRIIHRDIKPANILLDKNLNSKIADFGLAKPFSDETKDIYTTLIIAGTRGYFAPEYALDGRLSTKADVYSFGILVLEIISGKRFYDSTLPFEGNRVKAWAKQLQKSGTLLDFLDPTLRLDCPEAEVARVINVALMCARNNPKHRPIMSEVESMLLEGKERTYDILSSASNQEADDDMPGPNSFKSFQVVMGSDATASWKHNDVHTSQSSNFGVRFDELPLLTQNTLGLDLSSGTRSIVRSMRRSLSARVRGCSF